MAAAARSLRQTAQAGRPASKATTWLRAGVVRRGLKLLREATEREALREAYRRASRATRASLSQELAELDHLAGEGLSES